MFKQVDHINLSKDNGICVLGVYKDNTTSGLFQEQIERLANQEVDFFKLGNVTEFYPMSQFNFKSIVFIGLGQQNIYSITDIQTVFSNAYKNIKGDSIILLDTFIKLNSNLTDLVEKAVETIELVNYKFSNYKLQQTVDASFDVTLYSKEDLSQAIEYGIIQAEATNHARNLVNEPRNKMTPTILANYSVDLAEKLDIKYKVYNKEEIKALGMGAFLSVNQGSKEEAKLIHLQYRKGLENQGITTLIGKGVTYDSGGYSIKPKDGMAGMKGDMAGAAAVLGAIEVIARKGLKVNVDVVIAATDNLINSDAIVPDDVVIAMNGKSIEILNTDAEGRLTLIDAVSFAKSKNTTRIIDVATLTGGVITALGFDITGGFTNNEKFYQEVKQAALVTGEDLWQLPVEQFRDRCKKSEVADYNNSPGRDGHASFGAAIIAEFVEDTPWVHLDIAGTSSKKTAHLLGPAGATGVMVRTLSKIFE